MGRGLSKRVDERIHALLSSAAERGAAATAPDRATAAALARRVARGNLVSPLPGAYADAELWASLERRPDLRALMLARAATELHPDWTFCHATAALAHDLRVSYRLLDRLNVTSVPPHRPSLPPTASCHYVRNPEPILVDGVRATSLRMTTLDFLRTYEPHEGLIVADAALTKSGMIASQLVEELRAVGAGLPGISRALSVASYADSRAESGAESMARAMMIRLRYTLPELQVWVANPLDDRHPFRVDCLWILADGTVVICEVDGQEKRRNEEMTKGKSTDRLVWEERQRESLLSVTGARIVRLSSDDVRSERTVAHRLDAFGVPRAGTPEGREIMRPDSAMHGGRPAPGGAVIRDGWLRYER